MKTETLQLSARLAPVPRRPRGRLGEVYAQMKRDFGLLAPPLLLHVALPDLFAAAWACLRETVLVEGALPRRTKEAMAVAISQANRCPYCVDAHAVALHSVGGGRLAAQLEAKKDSKLPEDVADLLAWAASPPPQGPPPCSDEQRPEALATALCFQYVNRMVTALLPETMLPLGGTWLRRPILGIAGRWLAPRGRLVAGESLPLVPRLEVPEHLAWGAAVPPIALTFAALDRATEDGLAELLAESRRQQLRAHLAQWQGEEPPLGRGWLEEPVAGWPRADAVLGRAALLAAMAPHRLTDSDLGVLRDVHPGDRALVAALAWGSYQAARRVSEWFVPAEVSPKDP